MFKNILIVIIKSEYNLKLCKKKIVKPNKKVN